MNIHIMVLYISIMLFTTEFSYVLSELGEVESESNEYVDENSDQIDAIHEARHRSLKHKNLDHVKRHILSKRDDEEIKKLQCAVMYKNDEPVGILQPSEEGYQLLPVHMEEGIPVDVSQFETEAPKIANKRDTKTGDAQKEDEAAEKNEAQAQYSDERYPYIFAKFKIDSKLTNKDNHQKTRSLKKRASEKSPLFNEKHNDALRSTLSRVETDQEGAAVDLTGILSDMGLIEEPAKEEKREVQFEEDEDLEHGTNKINMVEIQNENDRPKRGDSPKQPNHLGTATKHYNIIELPEPKSVNKENEAINEYIKEHPEHFKQNQQEREKRSEEKEENKGEQSQSIVAHNEKRSADTNEESETIESHLKEDQIQESTQGSTNNEKSLTDSAPNQQNLDEKIRQERSNTEVNNNNKVSLPEVNKQQQKTKDKSKTKKEHEQNKDKRSEDYAQEMEKRIKERLQKIKEEVRGEIEQIKANSDEETEESDVEEKGGKSQRKKRNIISSLVEQETSDVDPVLAADNNLIPHVRPRRNLEAQYAAFREDINAKKNVNINNMTGKADNRSGTDDQNKTVIEHPTTQDFPEQHVATTSYHFLVRNLKAVDADADYEGQSVDLQYDQENEEINPESDENPVRNKKSCKCIGKNCKCPKQPTNLLAGEDGSEFIYFDGAPRLLSNPHYFKEENVPVEDLRNLPKKERPIRDNEKNIRSDKKLEDGRYILDLEPDVYKVTEDKTNYLDARKKRSSFVDLVALHGGDSVINHLYAIRERSMLPRTRAKRKTKNDDRTVQQLTLTDMSGEDLFGALPQNFEGELSRIKRVKRNKVV